MSNEGGGDGGTAGADDVGGSGSSRRKKLITWDDEYIGIYLELLDVELARIKYKQKMPKEIGRDRICEKFLETTGISLPWDSFKSKYDTLRNKWSSYKRLINFTGIHVDHSTGLITMDSDWWDDREKEIPHAKQIRENGIPHMELMRRIFGRQGSKPEAMYPTHKQDAKVTEDDKREPLDKFVPITLDDDGDDSNLNPTNAAYIQSQNIKKESPPLSPIGPSKRPTRKQSRVTPYQSNRGKDVLRSGEKSIPRRRNAFEAEISGQFKEMMEFRRDQVAEARERRDKNEATPYKEAYGVLQSIQGLIRWTDFWWACIKVLKEDLFAREMMVSCENDHEKITFLEGYTGYDRHGYFIGDRLNKLQSCKGGPPSVVNLEQNISNTNMETHEEFNASHAELMSLFKEIGYERGTRKTGCDGESSQTKINLED